MTSYQQLSAEQNSTSSLTDDLSKYLRLLFAENLERKIQENKLEAFKSAVPDPHNIRKDLRLECQQIAHIACMAFRTHCKVPWDVVRYCDRLNTRITGTNLKQEADIGNEYRPIFPDPHPIVQDPCIVVDMHGKILLWYLPGILSQYRQECMWKACSHLEKLLNKGRPKKMTSKWRSCSEIFSPENVSTTWKSGAVSFSPGWSQQGHESVKFPLEVSASLKSKHNNEPGLTWLDDVAESFSLLSAVLSIIHPGLFNAGRSALMALREEAKCLLECSDIQQVLDKWTSVYSAVQIISNRETPLHRDYQSRAEWYDLLATIGPYQNGAMEIPGVGLRLSYSPGTVVGIGGKLLQHGVSKVEGERICYAFYMRNKVHERLNIKAPGWMEWDYYGT